jgi:hypothetical protein
VEKEKRSYQGRVISFVCQLGKGAAGARLSLLWA